MKTNLNLLKAGALLFALPLMATAAVSASQWASNTAPIELNVDIDAVESDSIGVARVHTVALNSSGAVEGRVAAMNANGTQGIADLTVYFLSNGKVADQTKTSADGSFRVSGLKEGNYSFVATGENGFAAYGVQVVGETAGVSNTMEAAAVAPNFAAVKQILNDNLPSQVATEIVANVVDEDAKPLVGANRVALVEGKLVGNVRSLVTSDNAGATVHILKGDKKVASVEANENGSFSVSDLEPGVYGFVATGPSGFAALSFEAVQDENAEIPVAIAPAFQDVMFDGGYAPSLDVCTTCGTDVGYADDSIVYDSAPVMQEFAPVEYAGESIGCGGACGATCGSCGNMSNYSAGSCGGCCGSGGGGLLRGGRLFGGAGLGRLLLLGGAIALPVALSGDSDSGGGSNELPQ
jgi:hypothetical protein